MIRRVFIIHIIAGLCLAAASHASINGATVTPDDFIDMRTSQGPYSYGPPYSSGGLSGKWEDGFTISWNIYNDFSDEMNSMLWTYEYTLLSGEKDISSFFLEVGSDDVSNDIFDVKVSVDGTSWQPLDDIDFWQWKSKNGEGMTRRSEVAGIYGLKFEPKSKSVSYMFDTLRRPVWGSFYASSGDQDGEHEDDDKGRHGHDKDRKMRHHKEDERHRHHGKNHVFNKGLVDADSAHILYYVATPGASMDPVVVPEPPAYIIFISGGIVIIGRQIQRFSKL